MMLLCTEPGRCTRRISVFVRVVGCGRVATAGAVPLQLPKYFWASSFVRASVISPATTSSAPVGASRDFWNMRRSSFVSARTVPGVGCSPYGCAPKSWAAKNFDANALGCDCSSCSAERVCVRASSTSFPSKVGFATASPTSSKASGASSASTFARTVMKSVPELAPIDPPTPSMAEDT